jgi:hypothetical protein
MQFDLNCRPFYPVGFNVSQFQTFYIRQLFMISQLFIVDGTLVWTDSC